MTNPLSKEIHWLYYKELLLLKQNKTVYDIKSHYAWKKFPALI